MNPMTVLHEWRSRAAGLGLPVPSDPELALVAQAPPGSWPYQAGPTLLMWQPTLLNLLDLTRRGHPDPIGALSPDLHYPQQLPSPPSQPMPQVQQPAQDTGAPSWYRRPDDAGPSTQPPSEPAAPPTPDTNTGVPAWYRSGRETDSTAPPPQPAQPPPSQPIPVTPPPPAPPPTSEVESRRADLLAWLERHQAGAALSSSRIDELLAVPVPEQADLKRLLPSRLRQNVDDLHRLLTAGVPAEPAPSPHAPPRTFAPAAAPAPAPGAAPFPGAAAAPGAAPFPGAAPAPGAAPFPGAAPTSGAAPFPGAAPTSGAAPFPGAAPGGPASFPSTGAGTPPPTAPGPAPRGLDVPGFAAFDFNLFDYTRVPVPMILRGGGLSPVELSWPGSDDGVPFEVHRVVYDDDSPPHNVDHARSILITDGTAARDEAARETAVRYYQVWTHQGESVEDACRRQPFLAAEGHSVSQVQNLVLREEDGAVTGQWSVFEGTTQVEVYRLSPQMMRSRQLPLSSRVASERANLGGFIDRPPRGKRWIYALVCVAPVVSGSEFDDDGNPATSIHKSTPVFQELAVSAPLETVTDLTVRLHEHPSGPTFDLLWTPPSAGRVEIYRTKNGPAPGLDRQGPLEMATLAVNGLSPDSLVTHPVERLGEQHAMEGVSWPAGDDRVLFTPVTVLDGMALVGRTVVQVRVPPVTEVTLVERVNEELLTFGWPRGASHVEVRVGTEDPVHATTVREISHEEWAKQGGLHLNLDPQGCFVHLVSIAFAAGAKISGEPVTIRYNMLLRVHYTVTRKSGLFGGAKTATITLGSYDSTIDGSVRCVLVHHPARLPLHAEDGTLVQVRRGDQEEAVDEDFLWVYPLGPESFETRWTVDLRPDNKPLNGFLRVFAAVPPEHQERIAVIDPAVRDLRLDG